MRYDWYFSVKNYYIKNQTENSLMKFIEFLPQGIPEES